MMAKAGGHMLADFCQSPFLGIALVSAGFFGVYGLLMTWVGQRENERELQQSKSPPWPKGRRPRHEKLFSLARLIFEFWFNAAGGVAGWMAVWFLWRGPVGQDGGAPLIVFIFAVSCVTRHLPYPRTCIRAALAG